MTTRKIFRNFTLWFFLIASFGCTGASESEKDTMNSGSACDKSRLTISREIVKKILEDIPLNYDQVGGEISGVKLVATNVYVVSISQEERVDQLTYEVEVDQDCSVKILNRTLTVESPS